jgi:hypothetical protein
MLGIQSLLSTLAAADTPASRPATPTGPRRVAMALSPAAEPSPARRYQLLPRLGDQVPGNAESLMLLTGQLVADLQRRKYDQIGDWADLPTARLPRDQIRPVLEEAAKPLHYARLSAVRETCSWDVPFRSEGLNAELPSLAPYRAVSKLLNLRARMEIADGRMDEALADLQAGFADARWCGMGPTLIHQLVGAASAIWMCKAAEEWVQAPGSPNLYWALAELPRPLIDPRSGYAFEAECLYFDVPQLRNLREAPFDARQAEELLARLVALARTMDAAKQPLARPWTTVDSARHHIEEREQAARKALAARGYAAAMIAKYPPVQAVVLGPLEEFETLRDDQAKLLMLPYAQVADKLDQFNARLDAVLRNEDRAYPFAELIPKLQEAHSQFANLQRHITALQCLEAIRMHMAAARTGLPGSLAEIGGVPVPPDPMTGRPFGYERTSTGAVLICPPVRPGAGRDGIRYELTAR